MTEDCVIIGGGVAGLSAANRLVDMGVSPLIIEGGKFPSHKICGEFFSHECLSQINEWDIPLTGQVSAARFIYGSHQMEFKLPIASGTCSRYTFDQMLLDRAVRKGARVLTETSVLSIEPEIILSNGTTLKARSLMIGTGKMSKVMREMKYYGYKAHFQNLPVDCLEMHLFSGGYLGISKIDERTTNIAGLIKNSSSKKPEELLPFLKEHHPKWLVAEVPEFGIRKNPSLSNVFWIGDAAGSIPPISGDGLAIAITSGCLAADCLIHSSAEDFRKKWLQKYRKRFLFATYIHKILMTDPLKAVAIQACNLLPAIPKYLWRHTRGF